MCEHVHLPLHLAVTRPQGDAAPIRASALELVACAPPSRRRFGTDIIVGFPGETEADFAETLEVVEEVGFDSAFTFVYSPRAGTEAAARDDQVPHDVKIERMERLVESTQEIAHERNAARVGRVEEVLVEGPSRTDESVLRGRTRRNTTVVFTRTADAGELVPVLIESATSMTLRGVQEAHRPLSLAGLSR